MIRPCRSRYEDISRLPLHMRHMANPNSNSELINAQKSQRQSGPYSNLEVKPETSLPEHIPPPEKESYTDPSAHAGNTPSLTQTHKIPKPNQRLLSDKWFWLSVFIGVVVIGAIIGGAVGGTKSRQNQP
jgi:hypothetical protein